ncbi:MAG: hypothetical protein U0136_00815 [Bdellovibrionota bacterium]
MDGDGIGIRTFADRTSIVEIGAAGFNGTKTRHALMELLRIDGPKADEIVCEAIETKGKWLTRHGPNGDFTLWVVCTQATKRESRRSTFQVHLGGLDGAVPSRLPYVVVESVYGFNLPDREIQLVEASIAVHTPSPTSSGEGSASALTEAVSSAPWLSPLKPHRRRFWHLPKHRPCLPLVLFAVNE